MLEIRGKCLEEFLWFPMKAGNTANSRVTTNPNKHVVVLEDIPEKTAREIKRILQDAKIVSPSSQDNVTGTTAWLMGTIVYGHLTGYLNEEVKHKIVTSAVFREHTGLA